MSVQQGEVVGSSPYNSSCCRLGLYRLLLALLLAPSPRCPPPLACALKAFSLGQWEDSLEVIVDLVRSLIPGFSCFDACLVRPCVPDVLALPPFLFLRSLLSAQKLW